MSKIFEHGFAGASLGGIIGGAVGGVVGAVEDAEELESRNSNKEGE